MNSFSMKIQPQDKYLFSNTFYVFYFCICFIFSRGCFCSVMIDTRFEPEFLHVSGESKIDSAFICFYYLMVILAIDLWVISLEFQVKSNQYRSLSQVYFQQVYFLIHRRDSNLIQDSSSFMTAFWCWHYSQGLL